MNGVDLKVTYSEREYWYFTWSLLLEFVSSHNIKDALSLKPHTKIKNKIKLKTIASLENDRCIDIN